MRITTVAAVLVATLTLTACTSSPEHKSGDAAPAGSAAASATPSTAPSTTPSTVPSSTAPTTATNRSLTLGPLGYGALRLGMTKEQALATGLLTPFEDSDGCDGADLKDGGGGALLSPTLGVAAIEAGARVATPEGVRVGTSLSDLRRAYPEWRSVTGDPDPDTRGSTPVPGNSKARYRIETRDGKVLSVTLQLTNQNCYE
jgi:hypothetical protein